LGADIDGDGDADEKQRERDVGSKKGGDRVSSAARLQCKCALCGKQGKYHASPSDEQEEEGGGGGLRRHPLC
jgi:hypothetical protein